MYTSATVMASTSRKQQPVSDEKDGKEQLPPLSDHEFKAYNRLAERMDAFHEHFRQTWTLLWTACTTNRRPRDMTLKQFLDAGLQFVEYLTAHHSIEERMVFPMLGKRMPEFRGDLQAQHREIHAGLDNFEAYLRGCKNKEHDFDLNELKVKMEPWGDVLWTHLDDEVRTLGADNMRKYWSLDEMRRMPM